MAITLDNTASRAVNGSSDSFSFTVAAGASLLVVAAVLKDAGAAVGTFTSITFNGVALTSLVEIKQSNNAARTAIYYLKDPPAGTFTLAITGAASTDEVHAGISSWFGAGIFRGTGTSAAATTTTPTVVVTSVSGDIVVDCAVCVSQLITAMGANQTAVKVGVNSTVGASYESAGGVSTTMDWTVAASSPWATAAGAIIPALLGVAALASVATVTALAKVTWAAQAPLTAAAAVTAVGTVTHNAIAAVAGISTLAAVATVTRAAVAVLAAVTAVTSLATVTWAAIAAITSVATVTALGSRTQPGSVVMAGESALTVTGRLSVEVATLLQCVATIAAFGVRVGHTRKPQAGTAVRTGPQVRQGTAMVVSRPRAGSAVFRRLGA